jgi:hypothetical protein
MGGRAGGWAGGRADGRADGRTGGRAAGRVCGRANSKSPIPELFSPQLWTCPIPKSGAATISITHFSFLTRKTQSLSPHHRCGGYCFSSPGILFFIAGQNCSQVTGGLSRLQLSINIGGASVVHVRQSRRSRSPHTHNTARQQRARTMLQ